MNTSGMGYKILDERYALLECLAVSGIGEIYRGRDLELAQTENVPSRILIHLLPNQYHLPNLAASTQQAQELSASLNKAWLLPILAQGVMGDRQYFVLQSPESLGAHSVMSLPNQQLPALSKLTQQFGSLVKHKQLPKVLDSAFLISLPNQNLYLLATALIQSLHALRAPHTGLSIYQPPTIKRTLALSSIMAIAVSTFAVEYRDHNGIHATLPIVNTELTTPQILLDQAEAGTKDRPVQTELLALPLALQEPLPKLEPALVKLNSAANQSKTPATLTANQAPAPALSLVETTAEKNLATIKPPNKQAEDKPKILTKTKEIVATPPTGMTTKSSAASKATIDETVYSTASLVTLPVATQPKKIPSPVIALSMEDLINRANQALEKGNFSTKNGVLFYARQIRIRDRLHPQVERLGRFAVIYQHEVARTMLKTNESVQAHQLLVSTKNLIQEFNLKNLNSAQEVLEQKYNQYN